MVSITIITIVVVAILTAVIFGLAWLGYVSCLKALKLEISQGKHDNEIRNEYIYADKRKQITIKIISYTLTCILLIVLLSLFITGLSYKALGENLTINNKTILVIKSGSMSEYYDEDISKKYEDLGYSDNLQFNIGDMCVFEKTNAEEPLILGEVYGYKYKNMIITHRLIGTYTNDAGEIFYIFRGDNNPSRDQILVPTNNIIYHYTGSKIKAIGAFVLYAQSYLGIWSLVCLIGIIISSDIVLHKVQKLCKERAEELRGAIHG